MITKIYQQRLKKNLFRMSVFSFITVIVWLVITVYQSLTQSRVAPDVKKQLQPLTATLPVDTINQVNERQIVPDTDWSAIGQSVAGLTVNIEESASRSAAVASVSAQQD